MKEILASKTTKKTQEESSLKITKNIPLAHSEKEFADHISTLDSVYKNILRRKP